MALFKNKYRIGSARYPYWDYGFDGAYFITINTKNKVPYFGNITNGIMNHSPIGVIANMMWHEIKNHAKNVKLGEFIVMPDHIHGIIILDGNNDPRKNNACGNNNACDKNNDPRKNNACGNNNACDKNNDPRKNNACVVSKPDKNNACGNNNACDKNNDPRKNNACGNNNACNKNNDPRKNNACVVSKPDKNNACVVSKPDKNNACVVSKPDKNNACVVSTDYGQLRYQNLGKNTISSIIGGYKSAVSKHARRMGFEFSWQPLFYDRIIRDEYAFECISRYIINNPKNYLKKGR